MATASVSYTWTTGATIEASEHNQNFTDLVNFINTNCIQKDGSLAFTAVPTGPATNPSADNHLARKAYVDGSRGIRGGSVASKAAGWSVLSASGVYNTIGTFTLTADLTNNHYYEANLFMESLNLDKVGMMPLRVVIRQGGVNKAFGDLWIEGGTAAGGTITVPYRWKQSGDASAQVFDVQVMHSAGTVQTISLVGKAYLSILDLGV